MLSAVTLLLCVAVCVLWVRSYWRADAVVLYWRSYEGDASHSLMVQGYQGRFAVYYELWQRGGPSGAKLRRWAGSKLYIDPVPSQCTWRVLGFEWHAFERVGPAEEAWTLMIPIWVVALPAVTVSVVLGFWWMSMLQRRRPELCSRCGYDLRATPDRCPECGTTVPVACGGTAKG
jgi:hypothetical protein